jgi:hypothetical protein
LVGIACWASFAGERNAASGVDPTPKATLPMQSANPNSAGTTVNYMLVLRGEWCELKRNNGLPLDDATRQHWRGKL